MSDLHARLVAEIERWGCSDGRCVDRPMAARCTRAALAGALKAVVELHKPEPGWTPPYCLGERADTTDYEHDVDWPCPTIQTIARELGVEP